MMFETLTFDDNLVMKQIQSFTNINMLLDTNKSYLKYKKDNVYITLGRSSSNKYKNCDEYRTRINNLVKNIRDQLSLNFQNPIGYEFKHKLTEVTDENLDYLGCVNALNLANCYEITTVDKLKNVRFLNLSGCYKIINFGELGSGTINELILDNLDKVIGIEKLGKINTLSLRYTKVSQAEINCLGNVQSLNLCGNKEIVDVKQLCDIKSLDLSFCQNIRDVSYLANAYKLILRYCINITNVSKLGNIQELDLSYCTNLIDVSFLRNNKILYLRGCSMICDVTNLGNCDSLYLSNCPFITCVKSLASVRKLVLYGCTGITDIKELMNVKILNLQGCLNVSNIDILVNNCRNKLITDGYGSSSDDEI